jgi:hypothetical protein
LTAVSRRTDRHRTSPTSSHSGPPALQAKRVGALPQRQPSLLHLVEGLAHLLCGSGSGATALRPPSGRSGTSSPRWGRGRPSGLDARPRPPASGGGAQGLRGALQPGEAAPRSCVSDPDQSDRPSGIGGERRSHSPPGLAWRPHPRVLTNRMIMVCVPFKPFRRAHPRPNAGDEAAGQPRDRSF